MKSWTPFYNDKKSSATSSIGDPYNRTQKKKAQLPTAQNTNF